MFPQIRKCPVCKQVIADGADIIPIEAEVEDGVHPGVMLIKAEFHEECIFSTPPDDLMRMIYEVATRSHRAAAVIDQMRSPARAAVSHLN